MRKKKKKNLKEKKKELDLIGWREWISLPELNVKWIKAKIDTGARTSALHVSEIQRVKGTNTLKFTIHPKQRSYFPVTHSSAVMIGERAVKSSNGESSIRPVIRTEIKIGKQVFPIELTLVNRDLMGFRLLLGRGAIKNRYLVHTGKSFIIQNKYKTPRRR